MHTMATPLVSRQQVPYNAITSSQTHAFFDCMILNRLGRKTCAKYMPVSLILD